MRAIVVRRFGDPSVLRYEETPMPEPGEGEVRIRVRAAGTNPVDAGNRTDGRWAGIELPWIPGYEVAGVIHKSEVKGLEPGQRVVAMTDFPQRCGGYAEFAVAPASQVVPISDDVSYTAAAALPVAGGAAWDILERFSLNAGDRLLVIGASGGVGSYLLQLAKLCGVVPIAVGRAEHHTRLAELGAHSCLDYSSGQDASSLDAEVDAIADLVGGKALISWLAGLRKRGQIAAIEPPELDVDFLVDANITFHGVLVGPDPERLRMLAGLLADGSLTSHVAHLLPLPEATQAHRLLQTGHSGGKVVLTVG